MNCQGLRVLFQAFNECEGACTFSVSACAAAATEASTSPSSPSFSDCRTSSAIFVVSTLMFACTKSGRACRFTAARTVAHCRPQCCMYLALPGLRSLLKHGHDSGLRRRRLVAPWRRRGGGAAAGWEATHLLGRHQHRDLILREALLVALDLAPQVVHHAVHEPLQLPLVPQPVLVPLVQRLPLRTRRPGHSAMGSFPDLDTHTSSWLQ